MQVARFKLKKKPCIMGDELWGPGLAAGAPCLCLLPVFVSLQLVPPHSFLALLGVTPAMWLPPKAEGKLLCCPPLLLAVN